MKLFTYSHIHTQINLLWLIMCDRESRCDHGRFIVWFFLFFFFFRTDGDFFWFFVVGCCFRDVFAFNERESYSLRKKKKMKIKEINKKNCNFSQLFWIVFSFTQRKEEEEKGKKGGRERKGNRIKKYLFCYISQ